MPKSKHTHELLTTEEAAKRIGVAPGTLEVWRNVGQRGPKHVRLGNRVYYRRVDVDKFGSSQ